MESTVIVENTTGNKLFSAPVSAGMPFHRGTLRDPSTLRLSDIRKDRGIPLQAQCLSRWPDGSCRWVLLDFQSDAAANVGYRYMLTARGEAAAVGYQVAVQESETKVKFSTGRISLQHDLTNHVLPVVVRATSTWQHEIHVNSLRSKLLR